MSYAYLNYVSKRFPLMKYGELSMPQWFMSLLKFLRWMPKTLTLMVSLVCCHTNFVISKGDIRYILGQTYDIFHLVISVFHKGPKSALIQIMAWY